jgi:hypothetical protein
VSLKVAVYKKAAEHVIRCIDEVHRCIDEIHCCKNEVNHWTDQMNNHNGRAICEENSKKNTENGQHHFFEHSWEVKECLKEAKQLLNMTNERLKEERQRTNGLTKLMLQTNNRESKIEGNRFRDNLVHTCRLQTI